MSLFPRASRLIYRKWAIVPGIFISCKCATCYMQIQYTKNLNQGRFELGTTDIWSIAYFLAKFGLKIDVFLTLMGTNLIPDSYS